MIEKQARGALLLDIVKAIKANKKLDWNKYLKPEDWQTVNSIILPTKWYPFDLYHRCSIAVFQLVAEGNLEAAHMEGQRVGRRLFETTYKSMIRRKDPMVGLTQFVAAYSSLFNFSLMSLEEIGPWRARVYHDYNARDKGNIIFCHHLRGIFEVLVQMTTGKMGRVMIGAKQWEGALATRFDISWEER
jgi:hypothetical protein